MVVFNDFSTYSKDNYVRSFWIPKLMEKKENVTKKYLSEEGDTIIFNQPAIDVALDEVAEVIPEKKDKEKELHWLDRADWDQIGIRMTSTGLAILAVPDPIPIVDEVIGFTLVFGGLAFQLFERIK